MARRFIPKPFTKSKTFRIDRKNIIVEIRYNYEEERCVCTLSHVFSAVRKPKREVCITEENIADGLEKLLDTGICQLAIISEVDESKEAYPEIWGFIDSATIEINRKVQEGKKPFNRFEYMDLRDDVKDERQDKNSGQINDNDILEIGQRIIDLDLD